MNYFDLLREAIYVFIITLIAYILYEYILHIWALQYNPKGPFPLPVIGNLHLLNPTAPYATFIELSKKYGDVFSISFGMRRMVILNSYEAIKESLVTKSADFGGRPTENFTFNVISRNRSGLFMADYGPVMSLFRTCLHQGFRKGGNVEELATQEMHEMSETLKKKTGKEVDLKDALGNMLTKTMCKFLFGDHYSNDDSDFKTVLEFNNLVHEALYHGDPVAALSWLRFFPLKSIKKLNRHVELRDPFLKKKVLEHLPNKLVNSVLDSLLQDLKDKKLLQKHGVGELTQDNFEILLSDMIIAGIETTVTTLNWTILYLLHSPEYQDRILQELQKSCTGDSKYPSYKDRVQFPVTQAIIQETLRLSTINPLGVPRKVMVDSKVNGINIKKDSTVLFNIWKMHHNTKYWDNPDTFDPYRWLDENENYNANKHASFMPFQAGRRACLGETIARTQMFLILTRLIADFIIEPSECEPLPSIDKNVFGIFLNTLPFKVKIRTRVVPSNI